MIPLKILGKTYQVPQHIGEAQPTRLRAALRHIATSNKFRGKILAFKTLLPEIPLIVYSQITPAQWFDLLTLIDWLVQPTTVPLIKDFTNKGTTFEFAAPQMQFSSIIEFVMADNALSNFANGDNAALNELVYTLARRRKPQSEIDTPLFDGDVRERYNYAHIKHFADTAPVPDEIGFAALLFFIGCKNYIIERYPEVFEGGKTTENEDETEREPPVIDWLKIVKNVSETGLYGNYEATCHTPAHTFLFNLVFDIQRQKEIERKQRRTQNL